MKFVRKNVSWVFVSVYLPAVPGAAAVSGQSWCDGGGWKYPDILSFSEPASLAVINCEHEGRNNQQVSNISRFQDPKIDLVPCIRIDLILIKYFCLNVKGSWFILKSLKSSQRSQRSDIISSVLLRDSAMFTPAGSVSVSLSGHMWHWIYCKYFIKTRNLYICTCWIMYICTCWIMFWVS